MIKWLIEPNYLWMTIMQLMLPVFLYMAIGAVWYWWALCLLFYFIYLAIGNNIGMHRYFCHKYFTMSKPMEYFVTWSATMACLGSPLSYAGIHAVHHKHFDTTLDPHGPIRGRKSVLCCFHKHLSPKDISFTRNLTTLAKRYYILHSYYWPIVFGNALIIFLLFGWNALLFCWLIPVSLTLWAVAVVLLLQHDDQGANNSRLYMWFGWGETWHKNHHDDASLVNHAPIGKIDYTYQLTRLLAKNE